jgi:hypothetical protein
VKERAEGPYREKAAEDEGPVRRDSMRIVTWIGALVLLAVAGLVAHGLFERAWSSAGIGALAQDLAPTLVDPDVAEAARRFDPREQTMPELAPLPTGTSSETPMQVAIERGDVTLAPDARGILIEGRSHTVRRATLDLRTLGLGRRLAETPQDVAWVGVVRTAMIAGAYSFGPTRVDVEQVDVVIVQPHDQRVVARLSVRAAPPSSTVAPAHEYRVLANRVGDAIADALR